MRTSTRLLFQPVRLADCLVRNAHLFRDAVYKRYGDNGRPAAGRTHERTPLGRRPRSNRTTLAQEAFQQQTAERRRLRGGRRVMTFISAVGGIIGVGVLDYLTGAEIGVSLFYLLPIGVAVWYCGWGAGLATAVASASIWYLADIGVGHSYSHPMIALWNACIRLGFFLVTIILLHRLHQTLRSQRRLVVELQASIAQVRTLRGLIPICAWCKKIRDDDGYWSAVESYLARHSDAEFSHGICPECADEMRRESMTGD